MAHKNSSVVTIDRTMLWSPVAGKARGRSWSALGEPALSPVLPFILYNSKNVYWSFPFKALQYKVYSCMCMIFTVHPQPILNCERLIHSVPVFIHKTNTKSETTVSPLPRYNLWMLSTIMHIFWWKHWPRIFWTFAKQSVEQHPM